MDESSDFEQQWNDVQDMVAYIEQEFGQLQQQVSATGSIRPQNPVHAVKIALVESANNARDIYEKALEAYKEIRTAELVSGQGEE